MIFAKRPAPGRMPSRSASSLIRFVIAVSLVFALSQFSAAVEHKKAVDKNLILWTDPGDIKSKKLFYGPRGQEDQPQLPVTFVEEDANGHNPKIDVRDAAGKKRESQKRGQGATRNRCIPFPWGGRLLCQ